MQKIIPYSLRGYSLIETLIIIAITSSLFIVNGSALYKVFYAHNKLHRSLLVILDNQSLSELKYSGEDFAL